MTLLHGGNLIRASREYDIPVDSWLDLSTAISPYCYCVGGIDSISNKSDRETSLVIPEDVWRRLPDENDQLLEVAAGYYGCKPQHILAVPGSQFAIQLLPGLMTRSMVALPAWGYEEHKYWWLKAGHEPVIYQSLLELEWLVKSQKVDNAVVINPNNPSTEVMEASRLEKIRSMLANHETILKSTHFSGRGLLIVDEAFADSMPALGFGPLVHQPGLVVLRSMGKFFGLAGMRLGFVLAGSEIISALSKQVPLWAVSHPARWLGNQALRDKKWQTEQRKRLAQVSTSWKGWLQDQFSNLTFRGSHLFVSGFGVPEDCRQIYHGLARKGLLIRLIEGNSEVSVLRFGLPRTDQIKEVQKIIIESQEK